MKIINQTAITEVIVVYQFSNQLRVLIKVLLLSTHICAHSYVPTHKARTRSAKGRKLIKSEWVHNAKPEMWSWHILNGVSTF